MELCDKLADLRKGRGLSQLELAEAIHVSRQAISRWEAGTVTPSAENLKRLGEFYQISIDELLAREAGQGRFEGTQIAAEEPPTERQAERPGEIWKLWAAILILVGVLILVSAAILAGQIAGRKTPEEPSTIQLDQMESEVWTGSDENYFSITGW